MSQQYRRQQNGPKDERESRQQHGGQQGGQYYRRGEGNDGKDNNRKQQQKNHNNINENGRTNQSAFSSQSASPNHQNKHNKLQQQSGKQNYYCNDCYQEDDDDDDDEFYDQRVNDDDDNGWYNNADDNGKRYSNSSRGAQIAGQHYHQEQHQGGHYQNKQSSPNKSGGGARENDAYSYSKKQDSIGSIGVPSPKGGKQNQPRQQDNTRAVGDPGRRKDAHQSINDLKNAPPSNNSSLSSPYHHQSSTTPKQGNSESTNNRQQQHTTQSSPTNSEHNNRPATMANVVMDDSSLVRNGSCDQCLHRKVDVFYAAWRSKRGNIGSLPPNHPHEGRTYCLECWKNLLAGGSNRSSLGNKDSSTTTAAENRSPKGSSGGRNTTQQKSSEDIAVTTLTNQQKQLLTETATTSLEQQPQRKLKTPVLFSAAEEARMEKEKAEIEKTTRKAGGKSAVAQSSGKNSNKTNENPKQGNNFSTKADGKPSTPVAQTVSAGGLVTSSEDDNNCLVITVLEASGQQTPPQGFVVNPNVPPQLQQHHAPRPAELNLRGSMGNSPVSESPSNVNNGSFSAGTPSHDPYRHSVIGDPSLLLSSPEHQRSAQQTADTRNTLMMNLHVKRNQESLLKVEEKLEYQDSQIQFLLRRVENLEENMKEMKQQHEEEMNNLLLLLEGNKNNKKKHQTGEQEEGEEDILERFPKLQKAKTSPTTVHPPAAATTTTTGKLRSSKTTPVEDDEDGENVDSKQKGRGGGGARGKPSSSERTTTSSKNHPDPTPSSSSPPKKNPKHPKKSASSRRNKSDYRTQIQCENCNKMSKIVYSSMDPKKDAGYYCDSCWRNYEATEEDLDDADDTNNEQRKGDKEQEEEGGNENDDDEADDEQHLRRIHLRKKERTRNLYRRMPPEYFLALYFDVAHPIREVVRRIQASMEQQVPAVQSHLYPCEKLHITLDVLHCPLGVDEDLKDAVASLQRALRVFSQQEADKKEKEADDGFKKNKKKLQKIHENHHECIAQKNFKSDDAIFTRKMSANPFSSCPSLSSASWALHFCKISTFGDGRVVYLEPYWPITSTHVSHHHGNNNKNQSGHNTTLQKYSIIQEKFLRENAQKIRALRSALLRGLWEEGFQVSIEDGQEDLMAENEKVEDDGGSGFHPHLTVAKLKKKPKGRVLKHNVTWVKPRHQDDLGNDEFVVDEGDTHPLPLSSESRKLACSYKRRVGDWQCPHCQFMNFAGREHCMKCKAVKMMTCDDNSKNDVDGEKKIVSCAAASDPSLLRKKLLVGDYITQLMDVRWQSKVFNNLGLLQQENQNEDDLMKKHDENTKEEDEDAMKMKKKQRFLVVDVHRKVLYQSIQNYQQVRKRRNLSKNKGENVTMQKTENGKKSEEDNDEKYDDWTPTSFTFRCVPPPNHPILCCCSTQEEEEARGGGGKNISFVEKFFRKDFVDHDVMPMTRITPESYKKFLLGLPEFVAATESCEEEEEGKVQIEDVTSRSKDENENVVMAEIQKLSCSSFGLVEFTSVEMRAMDHAHTCVFSAPL